jgi:hypothetical protein
VRILISYHRKFISQGNASQAEFERQLVMDIAATARVIFHVVHAADALPGRSAAVMADPLTARLRKSLVLIHVTPANADQFQSAIAAV